MEHFEHNQPMEQVEREQAGFEYSPENPPPLEILESKVFAVHATSRFPENGLFIAGARDVTAEGKFEGDEPPSFRPTIHFSLGELVQAHKVSWENSPYTLISPLKNIEKQLVNVFAHDSFVVGNVRLVEGMTLLVPEGTDTSTLPSEVEVVTYSPDQGLRSAVDATIAAKQGWQFRMLPDSTAIGSVAFIENTEVNDADFFHALYEKYPAVSFGSHIESEHGDAFRFGLVEQMLNFLGKNYSDHWTRYATNETLLYRALILHNLQKLELTMKTSSLDPESIAVFDEKKEKVDSWLTIVDCDLELRHTIGKTLTGAREEIQRIVRAKRTDPEALRQYLLEIQALLPEAIQEQTLYLEGLAVIIRSMSPEELAQFMQDNTVLFEKVNLAELYARYAVNRWILIKNDRAEKEGLNQLLSDSLDRYQGDQEQEDWVLKGLQEHLNENSNRLSTALSIMRLPSVRNHLINNLDFYFTDSTQPTTLEQVIAAYPETRNMAKLNSDDIVDSEEIRNMLNGIDVAQKVLAMLDDKIHDFVSFEEAKNRAIECKWAYAMIRRYTDQIKTPLRTARDLDKIFAGDQLSLYELLRRDSSPAAFWQKLGLLEQYNSLFLNDAEFWRSELSLVEVYKALKEDS